MNTFHIKPEHTNLAVDALPLVQAILDQEGDVWIAIRGEEIDYSDGQGNGCIDEQVYTVSVCPNQEDPGRYEWHYVRAQEWRDAFERCTWRVVDAYGRERSPYRFQTQEEAQQWASKHDSTFEAWEGPKVEL